MSGKINDGNDETVAQLGKTGYVGSQEDVQDYFWGAGLPCILRILPDPPAKRILFCSLCNSL
ncbi:MAG TPA: hypothetical protein VLE95_06750, partial [Chlamydiales bacterium]|nr:hypothetical protein [Chlamydiales bacterium]